MSPLGHFQILVLVYALLVFSAETRKLQNNNQTEFKEVGEEGTRWAVLIAGSKEFYNYRHQAEICHAYQILRKGGLKDENIIVFMYDDIADSSENPIPGIIINRPDGEDVYQGVPKDYTGEAVNVDNFYNVLLGNEGGIVGGNGKVLKSGPNDHIFIYYSDHGAPGLLEMPYGEHLVANDFIKVLEKMHKLQRYNKMVIYVEACESGSIFDGNLKEDLNIFAMTAANAKEQAAATYCPGSYHFAPAGFDTCLGDIFSISWLEDSDINDMSKETLKQQYLVAKRRTESGAYRERSHVSHYGTEALLKDYLVSFIGTNPDNDEDFGLSKLTSSTISNLSLVNPRDIPLLHLQRKIEKAPMESPQRQEAQKKLLEHMNHREQIDQSITEILRLSLKQTNVVNLLTSSRAAGEPLVDNWDCFKTLVKSFKSYCGAKMDYGLKYTGALANVCNMGVDVKQTVSAIQQACSV